MNIILDIKCPELAQAINNLAAAMSIRSVDGALQDIVKPAAGKVKTVLLGGEALTGKPITAKVKAAPETADDDGDPRTANIEERAPFATSSSVATEAAVDYTQVKAAVMKVSTAKGRQAAVDLLGEFGAKVGGDLTEEQWAPFLARAEQVLG